MKAIVCDQNKPKTPLKIAEVDAPKIKPDYVIVKVLATALNRADLLQREGKYPPPKGASTILGLEMAGEIIELGKDVKNWKVGDRVCGLLSGGGYAEQALVHQDMLIPIPDEWSFEEAAAIPEVFLTAYQTIFWTLRVHQAHQDNIKSILIHAGASGVGSAAIQLSKELGLKVFVTASTQKLSFCESWGADVTIDYTSEDFEKVILSQTSDKGVDAIIDFIGQKYWKQNINCLAKDGRMALLAAMSGAKVEEASLSKILLKRLQITGSTLRSRSIEYQTRLNQEFIAYALPLFKKKILRPVIDSIFDWSLAEIAHQHMRSNQNKGKIILRVE